MKKLFAILFFILLNCFAFSQEVVNDTAYIEYSNGEYKSGVLYVYNSRHIHNIYNDNTYRYINTNEKKIITHLVVQGNIDATSFRDMRDSFPNLTYLDLSKTQIVAHTHVKTDWINDKRGRTSFTIYEANTIPDAAFSGMGNLKKIILPESLRVIGQFAFAGCRNLKYISLPDSLETIGERAFHACTALLSIKIPEKINVIYTGTFRNCSALQEIINSHHIDRIGDAAFSGCESLRSFIFSDNISTITAGAFTDCKNLQNIILPDSIKHIDYFAFAGCSEFVTVNIPQRLMYIAYNAFDRCTKLRYFSVAKDNQAFMETNGILYNKSHTALVRFPTGIKGEFTVPQHVSKIAPYAFRSCSLTSVAIGKNVKSVGTGVFSYCTQFTQLPDIKESISAEMFYGCTGLTNIKIPESVKEIGNGAFGDCTSLTSIVLPDKLKEIGNWAFENCTSLTTIELPDKLKQIGYAAFRKCTSLVSIKLPDKLKEIEPEAFNGCTSLTSIVLPDKLKQIEHATFRKCTSLKSVKLSESLEEIGDYAFEDCISLISVELPDKVKTIGDDAFSNCTNLTRVELSRGLKEIALYNHSFEGCSNLYVVNIDKRNRSFNVADGCLFNKNNTELLKCLIDIKGKYEIPVTVKTIGHAAFANKKNLKAVSMSNVNIIGYDAFANCTSLSSVSMNNGITEIGKGVFSGCEALTEIAVPDSVSILRDRVFQGCKSLHTVIIPKKVRSIGSAFAGCTGLQKVSVYWQNPKSIYCPANFGVSASFNEGECRCILEVPSGTFLNYSFHAMDTWRYFKIIEREKNK